MGGSRDGPALCEVGGSGTVILPLFGDAEQRWPHGLRAVLYCLGLGWCFLGVAIVSDIFMGAIEKITSEKTRRYNAQTRKYYTAVVWNPTVANLTLMALGSSAPEILLNIVETVLSNNMYAGDLGPGTIVGSAAFNLLVIIALCISAIPHGEVRKIKDLSVYFVTASSSILAYIWLIFVLQGPSPHVVEPWEGIATFLFFPLLVFVAWLADRGYFSSDGRGTTDERLLAEHMTKEELAELRAKIIREHGGKLSNEMVAKIIAVQYAGQTNRAHYRVGAIRKLVGGKRVATGENHLNWAHVVQNKSNRLMQSMFSKNVSKKVVPVDHDMFGIVSSTPSGRPTNAILEQPAELATMEFAHAAHAVLENAGVKRLKVIRTGSLQSVVTCRYATRDGTAKAQGRQDPGEEGDYIHTEGVLRFESFEDEKFIDVGILDDYTYEEDEDFFCDLFDPAVVQCSDEAEIEVVSGKEPKADPVVKAVLGKNSTTRVVIIDDDAAGMIAWEHEEYRIRDLPYDFVEEFKVVRRMGGKHAIRCKYSIEADSAIPGKDFETEEGVLELEDGVCEATVSVRILARGRYNTVHIFRVVLSDMAAGTGATFDPSTDGGANSCIATVQIIPDKTQVERVDKVMSNLRHGWEKAQIGHTGWRDQLKAALFVNGGNEDDDEDEDGSGSPPSAMDWVMHVLTLPWKLLFALCPPTDYCGGWCCFVSSLLMIGLVTVVIGDIANLFGCVLPFMENEITAITFVALGTSLPDTFASKTAAEQDPYADASVGNVTGSNSVNVFLGLGLPWTIASLFWWFRGEDAEWDERYQHDISLSWLGTPGNRRKAHVVKAESLAFNVIVFSCCALCALFMLAVRRRLFGGELGGPKRLQYMSSAAFITLWVFYIMFSVLKIKGAL